ncbi:DUF3656 domain-containing protein, partial [Candidatus Skiveiella danica]
PSAERRIAVDLTLAQTPQGLSLSLKDARGHRASVELALELQPARDAARQEAQLKDGLSALGDTIFAARRVRLALREPVFLPAAQLKQLRRDGVAALEAARAAAL